ncbi:cell adhesion molecule L1-like a isoform X2 [Mastacembelus armatus]|nr:neural cell adhesion molecule L1-like protein isoform X2 [Mastacembelus armatus]XP_026188038.1 neural cell adhesion molecule L1-like protein isoform X2 [Mastacembelus armatus]XP_026188039.1 neural cell adhesion molecule L1-like protein isoform X2 [Mastacembelus armatus]XP_026188041.1 neural cell adhesion molecule L1-like protein isoform X2 [Mastacembelus armatus]XP_026188042.1 neural cell adhesion molecule L1-like protein isoform X2 [Mastacembelus armatus]XP_026188043.1 neural cell adhesion
MWSVGNLQLVVLLALTSRATGLSIPLEVEQLPTIITHTSGPIIALPFDNTVTVRCVARGNPPPEYRWTKDGKDFIPPHITSNSTDPTHGTFVLPNKHLMQFQGKYRCYASNKLGTAMTEEIELIVPGIPKFPKEVLDPIVVKEGGPVILKCNPPQGVAPRQIYWMSISLQHIEQNERVTMGIDGNLYFSNALQKDSRQDYCCYAAFSKIRTIVQKTAMAVVVNSSETPAERKPGLLLPPGVQTEKVLLKGEDLQLECIPEGFPTPTIKWMKLGDKLSPRTKYNKFKKLLIIPAVEERDQGKYMCTADNTVGEAVHYFDVIVEEPPTWLTGPPQSQLTVIGTDVHVKCSVTGKPPPDITWRRNGELLRDDPGNNRRVLDDTVVLHNARPEDTAVYQCEASNRHGSVMANINIMVIIVSSFPLLLDMAPLILTRDNQEYAVVLGGDITMNCSVFSSPPSAISWVKKKSSKAIDEERFFALQNGSLQIISAEKNDSGKYVCIAFNSLGKTEVTALLDVKDTTKIVGPPQDVQIISGTTAQLMCQTEYDKSLQSTFKVVWTKDGKEIPFSLEKNSRYFVDNGMLQIMNVNLSDQGMYTCIARTSLDEDNATALLTVLDVPDAPKNLEISELESPRNVRLSWVPGSDHNSSVTEFIVEYEESHWDPGRWKELQKVPGNQATAELMLHGHLDYRFRAYAVNAIGPGPPSEPSERYKTPPAAPDRNPENIKIQGHLPHQMDISWEPLLPIEQNGPGLEYQVSYRKLGVEEAWNDHLVQRHSIVVTNTPTFVPYEVRIRSRNSYGWAPEPKVVTGYSGEDVPTTAPQDVAVEVINTTVLRVSWTPVPPATVRGHLGGYNIHWLRKRNLLNPNKILDERQFLIFPGKRSHAVVPGLKPFSDYRLTVSVFNKKGNGPNSDPVTFNTPEGVPEQVPVLTASNAQKDSILLVWGPPLEANGILTGYLLQYHLINETTLEVVDSQERNITGAETTQLQLQGLEEGSLYRFHISACTRAGCGPPLAEESNTMTTGRVEGQHSDFSTQGWFIGTMCAVAFLTLIALMACFLQRNKGGKYAGTPPPPPQRQDMFSMEKVKEKEDLHPDVESQGMNDDTFCEYSDSEEKPLKGSSLCSLNEDDTVGDSLSQDSLVDYADGGGEFNEDGSFIGEYSGCKHRASVSGPSGPSLVTA